MMSFRGVVKNNLTLKTKSQYVIDRFEIKKRQYENHSNSRNNKKYSSTPTICWKFSKAFGTHPDPLISGDVCCYSQPRFDGAAKLFTVHFRLPFMSMASHILHKGIRWFSWPMISTLISSMEWPASLVCSDTADLRSQACTDFRRVHLGHLALVPSFVAVSPMYSASQFLHLILYMTPNFSSATISSFGLTSRWWRVRWGLKETAWTPRFLKILWRISETPS